MRCQIRCWDPRERFRQSATMSDPSHILSTITSASGCVGTQTCGCPGMAVEKISHVLQMRSQGYISATKIARSTTLWACNSEDRIHPSRDIPLQSVCFRCRLPMWVVCWN